MSLLRATGTLLVLLLFFGCGMDRPSEPRVTVSTGALAGQYGRNPDVRIFRGIPYAAPPVGDLRWSAPRPPLPWDGVRDATKFGSICVQAEQQQGSFYQVEFFPEEEPKSEDCLYLNVWTAARSADERRPVMVWIHGGAFIEGSGSTPSFDGETLAGKGVVLVTINYRLGVFGLMAHPELSEEAEYGASGNYGLLDQIAALRWVQENISAFGGDPQNVTVFGQSAGAASVNALLASPLTEGLFHRAILQSGSSYGFGDNPGLADAEEVGRQFATDAGDGSLASLRALPADTLLARSRGTRFSVNVDGYVLPQSISSIFERGDQRDVPILLGTTADEGTTLIGRLSAADYRTMMQRRYGEDAATFFRLYPADSDEQVVRSFSDSFSDQLAWGARRLAEVHTETSTSDAYLYVLTHVPPGREPERYGAFHSSDLVYVFGSLHAVDRPWTSADSSLSELVSSYWINFARSGNPNAGDLPPWPAFSEDPLVVMELGEEPAPIRLLSDEKLRFFEQRSN